MRIQGSMRHSMDKLNHISVLDGVNGIMNSQVLAIGSFDYPPIINVLVTVAGHLLLVRRSATIRIIYKDISALASMAEKGLQVPFTYGLDKRVRENEASKSCHVCAGE